MGIARKVREGKEVARWERWEGSDVARWGRWESGEVRRWEVPGYVQGLGCRVSSRFHRDHWNCNVPFLGGHISWEKLFLDGNSW